MKKTRIILLCIFAASFLPVISHALERFDLVTTQQMQKLLEQRRQGSVDFILVNSLDEMAFRNSFIPGSINIPLSRFDELYSRLGTDKNKLIIPY